jgi:hypothetical protein
MGGRELLRARGYYTLLAAKSDFSDIVTVEYRTVCTSELTVISNAAQFGNKTYTQLVSILRYFG